MAPLTHPTMTEADVRVWEAWMEQRSWLNATADEHRHNPWDRYECRHCGEIWTGAPGGSCLACRASICPECNGSLL